MSEAGKKRLCVLIVASCCCGAHGQEQSQAESDPQGTTAAIEEVIVRGQTRSGLRQQIELATDAIYDRFNEINSTDEFDIHCREEEITGSNIPRRFCRANFWRAAEVAAATSTVRSLHGTAAVDPSTFLAEALHKHRLLSEEMQRLVAEDDELRRAANHLAELEKVRDAGRMSRSIPASSSSRVVTAADEELPYDARVMAEVRMGRDSWNYELTHRTFAIEGLYGEIDAIDIECEKRSERFESDFDVEWTVPADWGPCELEIEAKAGTTFTLLEFDE